MMLSNKTQQIMMHNRGRSSLNLQQILDMMDPLMPELHLKVAVLAMNTMGQVATAEAYITIYNRIKTDVRF